MRTTRHLSDTRSNGICRRGNKRSHQHGVPDRTVSGGNYSICKKGCGIRRRARRISSRTRELHSSVYALICFLMKAGSAIAVGLKPNPAWQHDSATSSESDPDFGLRRSSPRFAHVPLLQGAVKVQLQAISARSRFGCITRLRSSLCHKTHTGSHATIISAWSP